MLLKFSAVHNSSHNNTLESICKCLRRKMYAFFLICSVQFSSVELSWVEFGSLCFGSEDAYALRTKEECVSKILEMHTWSMKWNKLVLFWKFFDRGKCLHVRKWPKRKRMTREQNSMHMMSTWGAHTKNTHFNPMLNSRSISRKSHQFLWRCRSFMVRAFERCLTALTAHC